MRCAAAIVIIGNLLSPLMFITIFDQQWHALFSRQSTLLSAYTQNVHRDPVAAIGRQVLVVVPMTEPFTEFVPTIVQGKRYGQDGRDKAKYRGNLVQVAGCC